MGRSSSAPGQPQAAKDLRKAISGSGAWHPHLLRPARLPWKRKVKDHRCTQRQHSSPHRCSTKPIIKTGEENVGVSAQLSDRSTGRTANSWVRGHGTPGPRFTPFLPLLGSARPAPHASRRPHSPSPAPGRHGWLRDPPAETAGRKAAEPPGNAWQQLSFSPPPHTAEGCAGLRWLRMEGVREAGRVAAGTRQQLANACRGRPSRCGVPRAVVEHLWNARTAAVTWMRLTCCHQRLCGDPASVQRAISSVLGITKYSPRCEQCRNGVCCLVLEFSC